MKKKIVFAMVSGSGEFPIDMLRYDSCCPATEEDSHIVSRSFNNYENWNVCVKKVLLESLSKKDLHTSFTEGRWRSFGCNVRMVDSPYEVPRESIKN
jgi:hypothetical protein